MSTLAPGYILQGGFWNYRILNVMKGDNTHTSTILKAEILPRDDTPSVPEAPKWAIIKRASPQDETAVQNMIREHQINRLPGVTSAECFRKLYDVIDTHTIALEWMDTTLAEIRYQPDVRTYSLIVTFLKAALASCIVLEKYRYVNTDYKPANILLSGIKSPRATAKVGDLGLVFQAGSRFNAQPYAMRAPEVFLGQACAELSAVWAIAAMLLCWIKPGSFGAWDSPHPLINEAWCMAKIKRLFPHWNIPKSDKVEGRLLKTAVDSANNLSEAQELHGISAFEEELRKVKMPQQLRDILCLMLVADSAKRPSALSVLASRELQGLEKVVGEWCD